MIEVRISVDNKDDDYDPERLHRGLHCVFILSQQIFLDPTFLEILTQKVKETLCKELNTIRKQNPSRIL